MKSIKYTHIATGESEFSVNLFKEHVNKRNLKCHYDVLPNGYDVTHLKEIVDKKREVLSKYAVTIGTYKYKKIKVALELFHQIKKTNNLKKFIVVGPTNNLPRSVINDEFVEVKPNLSRNL